MRDGLLADRPTEGRHSVTKGHERGARFHQRAYRYVRALPVRTLVLIMVGAYAVLTAAVVLGSPFDAIDHAAAAANFDHRYPTASRWLLHYVIVGQRGPSSHVAFVYLAYRALRQRSWRPLILFVTALTMLNVIVGSVKLATGRLGPALTTRPRAVFDGGDIFPSGHTANAVVIFGVLAVVAIKHRRAMIALAVFVSFTVGLSAIFLETHWVTDVLGGWIAGAIVLLALLPTYEFIERRALRLAFLARSGLAERMRYGLPPLGVRFARHRLHELPRELTSQMFNEDVMSR